MNEPLAVRPLLTRLRESSWLAVGATTLALVLLTSLGTAMLVQFGADEGRAPNLAQRLPRTLQSAPLVPSKITVDRIVGTFRSPDLTEGSGGSISLPELLSPPNVSVDVPDVGPDLPDSEPPVVPEPPPIPLPLDPGPAPTPPTLDLPVLPPIPLPVPLTPPHAPSPQPLPVLPLLPLVGSLLPGS